MLRSILGPLDGSRSSEGSLPFAAKVARTTGGKLHLAHVHVPYEPESLLANTQFQYEGVNVDEYDSESREREEKYLSSLAERLSGEGTPTDATLLEGTEVADRLSHYAEEVETDMIFMTTHGYSGVNRLWLGSVADEISELAESVLGPATELARATNAKLTLVHVVPSGEMSSWPVLAPLRERPVPPLDRAETYLGGIAEELRLKGVDVETRAEHGNVPATVIHHVADHVGADVIAMATHGYGGLKRTLLGSVADKLLRSSTLPLLIMRPALAT
jgi:nucleotide-binding universal stress UspA family protein